VRGVSTKGGLAEGVTRHLGHLELADYAFANPPYGPNSFFAGRLRLFSFPFLLAL